MLHHCIQSPHDFLNVSRQKLSLSSLSTSSDYSSVHSEGHCSSFLEVPSEDKLDICTQPLEQHHVSVDWTSTKVCIIIIITINPFSHNSNVQGTESINTKEIVKGIRGFSLKENFGEVKIESN